MYCTVCSVCGPVCIMELCEQGDGTRGVRGESEESLRCRLESRPLSCVEKEAVKKGVGRGSGRLVNDCFDVAD